MGQDPAVLGIHPGGSWSNWGLGSLWKGPYLGSDPAWSHPAQMTDPPCPVVLQRSSKAICYVTSSYCALSEGSGVISPQPVHRPILEMRAAWKDACWMGQ